MEKNKLFSFQSFKDNLEIITFIHFDAKYYFKDVEYLNNPETSQEALSTGYPIIRKIRIAFWRLGIIEIAKLFQESNNQHYNLIQFLKNLNKNYEEYDWIKELPESQISQWLEKFNSNELLSIRNRISIQRDNYFAHSDKNPKIELKDSKITFEEINHTINFTEDIMTKLNNSCLQIHVDFNIDGVEKVGNLLKMISYYNTKN